MLTLLIVLIVLTASIQSKGYTDCLVVSARIDDNDPGLKQSEPEEALRSDRWYRKNTDDERDNPKQSGLFLISYIIYCAYDTYNAYLT